jgi:cytochrome c-type biogenesis protein CcmH
MTSFWFIIGAMLGLAAAAVLVPLWFTRRRGDVSQSEINTRIFRERLADLDHELQQQRIDQTEYQQLRTELERTLLIDAAQQDDGAAPASRPSTSRWHASAITVLILLAALIYYYQSAYLGEAQQWLETQQRLAAVVDQAIRNPEVLPEQAQQDLPNFTRVLQAQALREGMRNPDSLFLLGVSLMQLEVPDSAVDIMHRAHRLAPQRSDIMMGYAQALLVTNGGKLTATSARLLQTVLQAEPNHQGALMMLGFGAFNAANYDIALQAWRPLLANVEPGSEVAGLLQQSITQAEQLLAQAQTPESDTTEPDTTSARIAVTVELAPELAEKLSPQDTLFIFAKAASGPPMPLAAVRQQAGGFPVQVVLDDSKAMTPSMKLSNFQDVVVGARISKAGDVMAKPGDLEGLSQPLSLADGPLSVSLVIDQIVQ